jgi:hypothetical protein
MQRKVMDVAFNANDFLYRSDEIKAYMQSVQRNVLKGVTVDILLDALKTTPANKPSALSRKHELPERADIKPEQGYAVKIVLSPDLEKAEVTLFSAYGNNELKPAALDDVQRTNGQDLIAVRTLDKALRALFWYKRNETRLNLLGEPQLPFEPVEIETLEQFLGDCKLTLGCAVSVDANGVITLIGTSGFQPNDAAIEMLDQITKHADSGLGPDEQAFLYSGIMDQYIARQLVGDPIGLSDLTRACISTPGVTLH